MHSSWNFPGIYCVLLHQWRFEALATCQGPDKLMWTEIREFSWVQKPGFLEISKKKYNAVGWKHLLEMRFDGIFVPWQRFQHEIQWLRTYPRARCSIGNFPTPSALIFTSRVLASIPMSPVFEEPYFHYRSHWTFLSCRIIISYQTLTTMILIYSL